MCYEKIRFLNAWPGTNDNAAFGPNCVGLHDFNGCSGADRISFNRTPIQSVYAFDKPTADIGRMSFRYTHAQWNDIPMISAQKMLSYYREDFLSNRYIYEDNVGYDTNIRAGIIEKPLANNAHAKSEFVAINRVYPNPFNNTTSIDISVPKETQITLEVFDIKGRKIANLADVPIEYGIYTYMWDGKDNLGNALPSGLYLIVLESRNNTPVCKVINYIK